MQLLIVAHSFLMLEWKIVKEISENKLAIKEIVKDNNENKVDLKTNNDKFEAAMLK